MSARLDGVMARIGTPLCLGLALCAVAAGAAEPAPVQVRLIADRGRLEPGGVVHVGALFTIAPGWHIYWKNPGDSGLATAVRLIPPAGVTVGALQWPLPERFADAGGLTSYGYQRSVLLAAELRLPADPRAGPGALRAEVSWLACREKCTLGDALLELELPPPPPAVEAALFERWRDELPQPAGTSGAPFELTVIGGVAAHAREGDLTVWLHWGAPPERVELFPEAADRLDVDRVRVHSRGDLTRIDMTLHVLGPIADRARQLPAVVAIGEGDARRGYEVRLPIDAGS